jgi:Bacterial Ig-like domain (group 2)
MGYSKTMRALGRELASGALAVLRVACGGGGSSVDSNAGTGGGGGAGASPGGIGGAPANTSLAVLPQRLGLAIGDSAALLARGATAATAWQASDSTLALVDPTGRVLARSRGGAVITATSGTSVAASQVTV